MKTKPHHGFAESTGKDPFEHLMAMSLWKLQNSCWLKTNAVIIISAKGKTDGTLQSPAHHCLNERTKKNFPNLQSESIVYSIMR